MCGDAVPKRTRCTLFCRSSVPEESTMATFLGKSLTSIKEFHPQIAEVNEKTDLLPITTLFIGDLSIFVGECDLFAAFQCYGTILDIKVMRCEETHKNLSYGFVKFEDVDEASAAMVALNGQLLAGRPMRISWATHKEKKCDNEGSARQLKSQRKLVNSAHFIDSSSLHVSFVSDQLAYFVDEAVLRSVFETFGDVLDISIKKYDYDIAHGTQKGYGFVHFKSDEEGVAAALTCTEELRNTMVDAVRYKCDISHKLFLELYGRSHPAVPKLLQLYPNFLKLVAREKNYGMNYASLIHPENSQEAGITQSTAKKSSGHQHTRKHFDYVASSMIHSIAGGSSSYVPQMMFNPMSVSYNMQSPVTSSYHSWIADSNSLSFDFTERSSSGESITKTTPPMPVLVGGSAQSLMQSSLVSPKVSAVNENFNPLQDVVQETNNGGAGNPPLSAIVESTAVAPQLQFWTPWAQVLYPFNSFSMPMSPPSPIIALPGACSFVPFGSNSSSRRNSFSSQSRDRKRFSRFSFLEIQNDNY